MSDDRPDDSPQPPSDEQRLALLEQSHRLNRLILIILSVALTMALASWATWGVVSLMADQADSVDGSQIAALHTQIEASAKQIEALQQQLTQLRTTASQPAPAPTPGKADDRAALQQVGAVLIAQEQSFQRSLVALKHGMRDLAGMIAGSRSWLADYNEALDKSLSESQERSKHLQQWLDGKNKPAPDALPQRLAQ